MSTNEELVNELRGFAAGSESARATLMRDAANAIEQTTKDRKYETEQKVKLAEMLESERATLAKVREWAGRPAARHASSGIKELYSTAALEVLAILDESASRPAPTEPDALSVMAEQARAGDDAVAALARVRSHAERWANRPPTSPYAMGLRDAWLTILNKIDAEAAAPAPIEVGERAELAGQVVTLEIQDGRRAECSLEDCECPEHEEPLPPNGLYVTVKLDDENSGVRFGHVAMVYDDNRPAPIEDAGNE